MMRGLKKLSIVMAALAALALGGGTAFANLIINGDFSTGGYPGTGFTSAYQYFPQPSVPATGYTSPKSSLYDEGTFGVGTNPSLYHGSWASFGDHTTGTGNMMIVNGAISAANINVWTSPASGTIPVTIGTTYDFSAFLTSSYPSNKSDLAFSINGILIGNIPLTAAPGSWQEFHALWTATGTTALLSLVDKSQVSNGNDFALDDISFVAVPEPGTLILLGSGLLGLAITSARKKFRK